MIQIILNESMALAKYWFHAPLKVKNNSQRGSKIPIASKMSHFFGKKKKKMPRKLIPWLQRSLLFSFWFVEFTHDIFPGGILFGDDGGSSFQFEVLADR